MHILSLAWFFFSHVNIKQTTFFAKLHFFIFKYGYNLNVIMFSEPVSYLLIAGVCVCFSKTDIQCNALILC